MDDLSLWRNRVRQNQGKLTEKYLQPPFSVLDTRKMDWQDRKREWLALGIQPELGRLSGLTYKIDRSTSVFDPVLCELIYRWFAPANGSVLDPFAGGSVRGIVASILGHPYTGIEISEEQIRANEAQAKAILPAEYPKPIWLKSDARNLDSVLDMRFDLIFTCPPYYNLEKYSDDPADLSNMKTYDDFIVVYDEIIKKMLNFLKPNYFAIYVVQDIRDTSGFMRGLEVDTHNIFTKHGAQAYNQMVLINMSGSAALRAEKAFETSRKVTRTHQSVLCFLNGSNPPKNWKSDRDSKHLITQQDFRW